jgi:acetoin utilization protein AcuB
MIVAQLMTPNQVTVEPNDALECAYQKMKTGGFRQVPVLDRGKLIGIVTDRDIRQYLGHLERTNIEAVMSALPLSVCPSTPVEQAAQLLVSPHPAMMPGSWCVGEIPR